MIVDALSIVSPSVPADCCGREGCRNPALATTRIPFLNLVLVENEIYLTEEGQEDPNGLARAVVDITGVHEWTREEAESQGVEWNPDYICWELSNVRHIEHLFLVSRDGKSIKSTLTRSQRFSRRLRRHLNMGVKMRWIVSCILSAAFIFVFPL